MASVTPAAIPPLMKPGQVVVMSIAQLHAYMAQHNLEPLAWRNGVLVLQRIVEKPMPVVYEAEKETL